MRTDRNIFIAFILNLTFAFFNFFGGIYTKSVAITSDAVHDLGDAVAIGVSYLFEKKSKKQPDNVYTYGYLRYSVIGGVFTTTVLLVGSALVLINAVKRLFNPVEVNYDGMIVFAVVGVVVNFIAAYFTREGDSVNQKAVNLHMLEDVLGWAVVLIGAVVMRFTNFVYLDSIMSIGVAVFILINSVKNLKTVTDIFLEKVPDGIDISEIKKKLTEIEGVEDVHHVHIRSLDGVKNYATMHIVSSGDFTTVKAKVKDELKEYGIYHSTLEFETTEELCKNLDCKTECTQVHSHHHHHH